MLAIWCALLMALWSPKASAVYTVDSIDYTLQWEMLSGYSETYKSPVDPDFYWVCLVFDWDPSWDSYYCALYWVEEYYVVAEADVWMPDGTQYYDGPPVLAWSYAPAFWGPNTVTAFDLGDWTQRGRHHVVTSCGTYGAKTMVRACGSPQETVPITWGKNGDKGTFAPTVSG
jgi:hypothetical protein